VFKKGTDRRTDGHVYIDSAVDADQEYIYFMGPVTHICTNVIDPFVLF